MSEFLHQQIKHNDTFIRIVSRPDFERDEVWTAFIHQFNKIIISDATIDSVTKDILEEFTLEEAFAIVGDVMDRAMSTVNEIEIEETQVAPDLEISPELLTFRKKIQQRILSWIVE